MQKRHKWFTDYNILCPKKPLSTSLMGRRALPDKVYPKGHTMDFRHRTRACRVTFTSQVIAIHYIPALRPENASFTVIDSSDFACFIPSSIIAANSTSDKISLVGIVLSLILFKPSHAEGRISTLYFLGMFSQFLSSFCNASCLCSV